MDIEIRDNRIKKAFISIREGDIFIYENLSYVKISQKDAIRLNDGRTNSFLSQMVQIPTKVILEY